MSGRFRRVNCRVKSRGSEDMTDCFAGGEMGEVALLVLPPAERCRRRGVDAFGEGRLGGREKGSLSGVSNGEDGTEERRDPGNEVVAETADPGGRE